MTPRTMIISATNISVALMTMRIGWKRRDEVGWFLVALAASLLILAIATMAEAQSWTEVDHIGRGSRSLNGNTIKIEQGAVDWVAESITMTLEPASLDGCESVDIDVTCDLGLNTDSSTAAAYCTAGSWIYELMGQTSSGSQTMHASLAPLPGYTWPMVSPYVVSVALIGRMSGSAAATITLTGVGCDLHGLSGNSIHHKRMSQTIKDRLRMAADMLSAAATAAGIAATYCATDPEPRFATACSVTLGILGTTAGICAQLATRALDQDPYDPAYREIFAPVPVPMADLSDVGMSLRPSFRDLIRNRLKMQSLWDALYVAINRANSAQDDGNVAAEALQQEAIDELVTRIEHRIGLETRLMKSFKAAWTATGRAWPL